MWSILRKLLFYALIQESLTDDYVINNKPFPKDFLFGTATSAYQIEGGWNEDGKGENIWDRFTHEDPSNIKNNDNGDVACDSYHKYQEDIDNLNFLGVNHYRFSISWARILPSGLPDQINPKGIEYYKNLINGLKSKNIQPLVTLYHWDLPQYLQDLGGFHNNSFPNWFTDYARICFENFGDDVNYWITFNEPSLVCMGYGTTIFAPGVNLPGVGEYLCMHNIIKSHAAAYHMYQKDFKSKQNGKLSMAYSINQCLPYTPSSGDRDAAEREMQFSLGWTAHPLYYGDYPNVMKERIAYRSKAEGFSQSRLPEFTDEEKQFINQTSDYVAINVYSTVYGQAIPEPEIGQPSLYNDAAVGLIWPENQSDAGMTQLLIWITEHYNKPDIIITENGVESNSSSLDDDDRIDFVKRSLSRFRDGIDQGINVFGYTLWSLMDNFEWSQGYSQKYGIYYVDFDDTNRTRTPKKSVGWYKKVIETHCLVDDCKI